MRFETRVLKDCRMWKNLRRNKIWYGNGLERTNLLVYREKVEVLVKLAMHEEAKERSKSVR